MSSEALLEFTYGNFKAEVLQADQPVLVDFWAEWCQPCRMITPIMEENAREYDGKVKVGSLDCDSNRSVPVKYGISAIPTVMLFKNGEVEKKFVGLAPKMQFTAALDAAV